MPQTKNQTRNRNGHGQRHARAPDYGEFNLPFGIFDVGAVAIHAYVSVCRIRFVRHTCKFESYWERLEQPCYRASEEVAAKSISGAQRPPD
jgi:hypothetical protein